MLAEKIVNLKYIQKLLCSILRFEINLDANAINYEIIYV